MLPITNAVSKKSMYTPDSVRDSRHSSAICTFGLFVSILFIYSYLPIAVFAQLVPEPNLLPPTNLSQFVNNFISILNSVIPLVAGFGFFGILTGVLKYIGAGGDEERLGKAKQLIFYGSIGIVVLYSFWGLASIFSRSYFLAI